MQEITREALVNRAVALLTDGTVDRVLGWGVGEFAYDVTPAVFRSADEVKEKLVWNGFCGANFSKYLIRETAKGEGKVLVFLKPCDTYSLNQLLTEHRLDREKVYVIGVPCHGMMDVNTLKRHAEGILSVTEEGDTVKVETLYDGVKSFARDELVSERCNTCKSKKHVAYDELLGDDGEVAESRRFDEVEKLEKMTRTSGMPSGRTSYPGASAATPAAMSALPAPVRSASSTTRIPAWRTKPRPTNSKRKCSISSVRSMWSDAVPTAANAPASARSTFRCIC